MEKYLNKAKFKKSFLIAAVMSLQFAQGQNIPAGYKLVWSDEFNVDGPLDTTRWNYEKGFVRNQEAQWYQKKNASTKNGNLIIEGRKEQILNPFYNPNSSDWRYNRQYANYTSACVTTKNNWQYGFFEIRAKIVTESGLWPAIWTLGIVGAWPKNGECDIMEYYGGNILANWAWSNGTWNASHTPVSSFSDPNWDKSFHIWKYLWTKDTAKIYLDNKLLNQQAISQTNNVAGQTPANGFRQSHYLLLNLALGGNNGGSLANTTFPSQYQIDYVRIYQQIGCTGSTTSSAWEYINRVQFGNIDNTSTATTYSDFTSKSTSALRGSTMNIAVTIGKSYPADKILVWCDWNNDKVFNPTTELALTLDSTSGPNPYKGVIKIPANAFIGKIKMRIKMINGANAPNYDPCGATGYGEVEDYTLNCTDNVTSIDLVGSDNQTGQPFINVYPSPIKDAFTIDISFPDNGNYKLEIVNAFGQIVYREPLEINNRNYNYSKKLNLTDLSKGVYIIHLSGDRTNTNKKVIIE